MFHQNATRANVGRWPSLQCCIYQLILCVWQLWQRGWVRGEWNSRQPAWRCVSHGDHSHLNSSKNLRNTQKHYHVWLSHVETSRYQDSCMKWMCMRTWNNDYFQRTFFARSSPIWRNSRTVKNHSKIRSAQCVSYMPKNAITVLKPKYGQSC